ncbi:MAG TPA: hypothetical protein PLP01_04395 [Phycisphaerae bacterium]|nr:hypothetical protein [Phycisphaerae bacterium]
MTKPRGKFRRRALVLLGVIAGLAAGWMVGRWVSSGGEGPSGHPPCVCERRADPDGAAATATDSGGALDCATPCDKEQP